MSKRAIQIRASLLVNALHEMDGKRVVDVPMDDDSSVEVIEPSKAGSLKRTSGGDGSSSPEKKVRAS